MPSSVAQLIKARVACIIPLIVRAAFPASIISATIPLAETFGYATDLRSLSQGRATYSMEFDYYEQVPASVAEEIGRRTSGEPAAV